MENKSELVGKIVWHDCVTNNISKSTAFYEGLFGWEFEKDEKGPDGYLMINAGGRRIGGFIIPGGAEVPQHWIAYIHVDDVDATTEKQLASGWTGVVEPAEIFGIGRFAVSLDPQGAFVAIFKGEGDEPVDRPRPNPGEFCWDELLTPDPDAAVKSYGDVFGWTFAAREMGILGTYHVASRGTFETAGITQSPAGSSFPARWLTYVSVANLDDTLSRVENLGGTVMLPAMAIPEVGRVAIIQDDQGGAIGLLGD